MKKKWLKISICSILSLVLISTTIPFNVEAEKDYMQQKISPLAKNIKDSQFSDEYKEWLKDGQNGDAPNMQNFTPLKQSFSTLNRVSTYSSLPTEYDLRDSGRIEPVYDQGNFGTCWAIGSNVSAGSSVISQFPQVSFSPIHTAWFSYRGNEEEEFSPDVLDPYQIGGMNHLAVSTMAAWKGPVAMEKAPFTETDVTDPPENLRYDSDFHLQDAVYLPVGYLDSAINENISSDIVKKLIMEDASVVIAYYASDWLFNFNEETNAHYCDTDYYLPNHLVSIAGWDDNYPKENFRAHQQPQNDGAWLIRNSWGTDFGDDGYFWLSYEDKTIYMGNAFILEEKDNYQKNYQYDTMGWCLSTTTESYGPGESLVPESAANIFTAESDEMLEAVSFYTTDIETEYSISIYTNVKDGEPQSGNLGLENQKGVESYPGYHTIELDQPVKLKKGEKFSIVVTLKNNSVSVPIAIEACPWRSFDDDFRPYYMGHGGESYVLQDGYWEDVIGVMPGYGYITNVCIKGFTNPLPKSNSVVSTVKYSEMEGPVKNGTQISLSANGTDEIYYSLNNSEYQKYTAPITLNFATDDEKLTISAYAVSKGVKGDINSKTYTKAYAQLTDLAFKTSDGYTHIETNGLTEHNEFVKNCYDSIQIMAQSGDKIYVNNVPLNSSDLTASLPLTAGINNSFAIRVEGEGKITSTYTLNIYRSIFSYDYANETANFDESQFSVTDADGNIIKSGDNISHLISPTKNTEVKVTKNDGTVIKDYIQKRYIIDDVGINYEYEATDVAFSDSFSYSFNSDMSDAITCYDNSLIYLVPGNDIYIRRNPDNREFVSNIFHLVVPDRPKAPVVKILDITTTSVTVEPVENATYTVDGNTYESNTITNLKPATEYSIYIFCPATETSFSCVSEAFYFSTKMVPIKPSDYSFTVNFVDMEGNPVSEPKTVTFDGTGKFYIGDIPLPVGYILLLPEDDSNFDYYPTALEYLNGQWYVTNESVTITVEKLAVVKVRFQTEDGTFLEDASYSHYYDIEGTYSETAIVPDGYEIVGDNTFTVNVTRNEHKILISDIEEKVFVVKAINSNEQTTESNIEPSTQPDLVPSTEPTGNTTLPSSENTDTTTVENTENTNTTTVGNIENTDTTTVAITEEPETTIPPAKKPNSNDNHKKPNNKNNITQVENTETTTEITETSTELVTETETEKTEDVVSENVQKSNKKIKNMTIAIVVLSLLVVALSSAVVVLSLKLKKYKNLNK